MFGYILLEDDVKIVGEGGLASAEMTCFALSQTEAFSGFEWATPDATPRGNKTRREIPFEFS